MSSSQLPIPDPRAIIYEDDRLYACLATYPISTGHAVVVWKHDVRDLHLLKKKDYEHLMLTVDRIRDGMLAALAIQKVYLIYMDEVKHVHWHLVPRYHLAGFTLLRHRPSELKNYRLAQKIRTKIPDQL